MASSNEQAKITIHGYFRSSCSARLRIALHLKSIPFEYIPVNIKDNLHLSEEYKKLNPSQSVPTMFVAGNPAPITQSFAGLEYVEEAYPDTPALLPKDPMARAQVRSLVNIIVADIQPVTNMKIMKKTAAAGYDSAQWSREFHAIGFDAYEAIIKNTAGNFSHGDELTLADVCLAPAVWNAERWGLDMSPYPTINKVYANASKEKAFIEGHWKNQVDCPADLKSAP